MAHQTGLDDGPLAPLCCFAQCRCSGPLPGMDSFLMQPSDNSLREFHAHACWLKIEYSSERGNVACRVHHWRGRLGSSLRGHK